MSGETSSFGALRALLQRHDEPFEEVCALLDAWGDDAELERVALPYAADHVRRWARRRPAPLAWRARLVRGERCPELAVCDELDLRFVRDLILPPSHTELADILCSADALSGITRCRVDLLEPGWADSMPKLEHLTLLGRADELGRPRALADFISGVPGVGHVELQGVRVTERDVHALDMNAPGGALRGIALGHLHRDDLDAILDWLIDRAPNLRALELHAGTSNGGGLDAASIEALIEALDAHSSELRLETLALESLPGDAMPSLRFDGRWSRLRRLAIALPSTHSEVLYTQLMRSTNLVNLEELWMPALPAFMEQRLATSGVTSELRRLRLQPTTGSSEPWKELLGHSRIRDIEDLALEGSTSFDELRALADNRYIQDLRSLSAYILRDLEGHQWDTLFASPGLSRLEHLSVGGLYDMNMTLGVLGALERSLSLPALTSLELGSATLAPLSLQRETSIDTLCVLDAEGDRDHPSGPWVHGSLCQTLRHMEVPEEWSHPSHVEVILDACPNLDVLVTEHDGDSVDAQEELLAKHEGAGVVGIRRFFGFGHEAAAHRIGRTRSVFDWDAIEPL